MVSALSAGLGGGSKGGVGGGGGCGCRWGGGGGEGRGWWLLTRAACVGVSSNDHKDGFVVVVVGGLSSLFTFMKIWKI